MRPMSKSEAARMHLSQVPAGIPFTSVNSDGEEDALSPIDRRAPALPLPAQNMAVSPGDAFASSNNAHNTTATPAAAMSKTGRIDLNTPPLSDEGHRRKQSVPRRHPHENDEDSDDSTSLLPWARHSRESSVASPSSPARGLLPIRNGSLAARSGPSAPIRTSSSFANNYAQTQNAHDSSTVHQLPPSPISSSESPVRLESDVAVPTITTTFSSRSDSRSGNTTVIADTPTDDPSRTSRTSSNYTASTNDDSDDEQSAENRRRDYTFSIYDVYGRDSVAFPNFDFRQYGSKSSLNKLAASKSTESLNVPGQRASNASDDRLQLPPSPQQHPVHQRQPPSSQYDTATVQQPMMQQSQAEYMGAGGFPRRPGQLTVPSASDASIPLALRSPSGRRPSAAPDPRMAGAGGVRGPLNMASSLRRQVEVSTPPVPTSTAPVSPLDAAGAAIAGNGAAGMGAAPRGPGAFDPRRRPSMANTAAPPRTSPGTLPPIYTGASTGSNASTPGSASGSNPSPPTSAGTGTLNSQDSGFMHRPGFAEARQRRRSLSLGTLNKADNLALNEAGADDAQAHAQAQAPLSPGASVSPPHNGGLSSAGAPRPGFRTSASSARSRNGPSTSPGLGPVRASSDRLSERERAHSGQGSGMLRKNPSNPTPGLHGGSGLHGLSPMARSTSPMSQLSAPSPLLDSSRRTSGASSNAYSTGPRSPALRSPLGMALPPAPFSAPGTPASAGPGPNGMFGFPPSPGSTGSPGGMGSGFDAMGFVLEPGVAPCMPQIDDPELKEKWVSVLVENDVAAAKKSRKVKKLVRAGIPPSLRSEVWLFLAEASVRRRPGLFEQLCKVSQGSKGKRGKEEAYETIEKDLHRTLPDHRLFMGENATGRADLEGILKSYVHFNPMLGYTQGMGLLAGFALIQMPAEDAFWLLCAVLRNPQMEEYYSAGMKQLHVDSVIFSNLLQSMDKELAARFDEVGLQPIMFTPNWFLPLFTRVLPWTTLVRVWDVFFYEGPTWMLRVALAIVRILREPLMNRSVCPSLGEMLQLLLHPPSHQLTVDNVLTCAFTVKLKDGEMRKLSRSASKQVREKHFLNQPADARGRVSSQRPSAAAGSSRSNSAPARR